MTRLRWIAQESPLNVDQVYEQAEAGNQGSIYDKLYLETQARLKAQAEAQSEPEPNDKTPVADIEPEDETPSDDADDAETPAEAPVEDMPEPEESAKPEEKADKPESEKKADEPEEKKPESESEETPATEDLFSYGLTEDLFASYDDAFNTHVAVEHAFATQHLFVPVSKSHNALESMAFLKELGIEYGPLLVKHVYKGVMVALEKLYKALTVGSVRLVAFIKQRIEAYRTSKDHIQSLRKTIDLLEDDRFQDPLPLFNDVDLISRLKVGKSVDFAENVAKLNAFSKDYFKAFQSECDRHLGNAKYLIDAVRQGVSIQPLDKLLTDVKLPGFAQGKVDGYEIESDVLVSYVYQQTLPGDILVIGNFPRKGFSDRQALAEASLQSKLFLGFNQKSMKPVESCSHLDKDKLNALLSELETLCDHCLEQEAVVKRFLAQREMILQHLKLYFKTLLNSQDKLSIENSLAEYINLKLQFIDRTYLSGYMQVHEYQSRVISSSTRYIAAAVKAYT